MDAGDGWQGVYRFDRYTVRGDVRVDSADPIRVMGDQVIAGPVETSSISAERLVIEPGAVLTQHTDQRSSSSPQSLQIEVGELVVEAGGVDRRVVAGLRGERDVSGSRLAGELTVVGATWARVGCTAARRRRRLGACTSRRRTGVVLGTTVGAVGRCGSWRIGCRWTERFGPTVSRRATASAGGSVWMTTGALAGVGVIEARGGNATSCCAGSGGGGAIAIEYGSLEPGSTVLDPLTAQGGSTNRTGGAGTVYLHGPGATYGELVVDNKTVAGNRRTVLPSLGTGVAQAGSGGAVLVTDRCEVDPGLLRGSLGGGAGRFDGGVGGDVAGGVDRCGRLHGDAGVERW